MRFRHILISFYVFLMYFYEPNPYGPGPHGPAPCGPGLKTTALATFVDVVPKLSCQWYTGMAKPSHRQGSFDAAAAPPAAHGEDVVHARR